MLVDGVEEVEAAGSPLDHLVSHGLQLDVFFGVVSDTNVSQVFEHHGIFEFYGESLDLGDLDLCSAHAVVGRVTRLDCEVHELPLVVLKGLKVVQVSQDIEIIGFLQDLLVSLHRADGLGILQDLANVHVVRRGCLLEGINLEMDLQEKELLRGESLVLGCGFVAVVDAARDELDQLVLNDGGDFTGLGESLAILDSERNQFEG